jgi:hypothetical protein
VQADLDALVVASRAGDPAVDPAAGVRRGTLLALDAPGSA